VPSGADGVSVGIGEGDGMGVAKAVAEGLGAAGEAGCSVGRAVPPAHPTAARAKSASVIPLRIARILAQGCRPRRRGPGRTPPCRWAGRLQRAKSELGGLWVPQGEIVERDGQTVGAAALANNRRSR